MGTNTPNLNLSKPAYEDVADIMVINGDMDILDTFASNASDAINYVGDLQDADISASSIIADHATIEELDTTYVKTSVLEADYIDADTIEANYADIQLANVNNAWISNGVIKDAAIVDAQIAGVSANKLTAGTIDAGKIFVINLNAKNLVVDSINGLPVIGGSYVAVDPSSPGYSSSNPKELGWYEQVAQNSFALSADTTVSPSKTYYVLGTTIVGTQSYIDGKYQELSDRIDGTIDTWTGSDAPTLNNYPAEDWTTDAMKDDHVGDIYFRTNGYSYRFSKNGNQYEWILVQNTDITDALERIDDLETFESSTASWIESTDEYKTVTTQNITSLTGVVSTSITKSTQLWYTSSSQTAPSAPSRHVDSVSTASGQWTTVVPVYSDSAPYYFYCYEYEYAKTDPSANTSYGWSAVVHDVAMDESQATGRGAQATANLGVRTAVPLWMAKDGTSVPSKPTVVVTEDGNVYGQWTLAVPAYNVAYPNYHYCYQYLLANGNYTWSDPVYDNATSEAMATAKSAYAGLATKVDSTTFNELSTTVDSNTASITRLTTVTEYGGQNLMPVTGGKLYGDADGETSGGITVVYDDEGWFTVSGTKSGSVEMSIELWANANGDYLSPMNGIVPQTGGELLSARVEVSGTPFISGSSGSTSTFIAFCGNSSAPVISLGGYSETSYTGTPETYISKVVYRIGASASGSVNGRFRIKLERGPMPTAWAYANADSTTVSNTVNVVKQTADSNTMSISGLTVRTTALEDTTETIANPNLSPFFAHEKSDLYNASTNPGGYWYRVENSSTAQITTYDMCVTHNGSDGWAHIVANITSASPYVRFEPRMPKLKPSTTYTVLLELDYVSISDTLTNLQWAVAGGPSNTPKDPWSSGKAENIRTSGSYYFKMTTASDISSATVLMRGYVQKPSNGGTGSYEVYARLSLYEGDYKGPYKPYVDQAFDSELKAIETRVTVAETNIEQNQEQIELRATKTEVAETYSTKAELEKKTNLLLDTDVPTLTKVNATGDRYWSDSGNASYITCELYTLESDKPDTSLTYGAKYTLASNVGTKNRSLCWGTGSPKLKGGVTYTVSFYYRVVSGSAKVRAAVYDGSGTVHEQTVGPVSAGGWNLFTYTFTITTDSGSAWDRWYFYIGASGNSEAAVVEECGFRLVAGDSAESVRSYASAEFTVQADEISSKVSKNGVISEINQSPESVTINANRVNIEGAAIFTNGGAYDVSTTVVSSQTQWYSSTSASSLSGGSWATTQPSVTAGRYIWQREYVTYANGNHAYLPGTNGVCTQAQTDLSSYSTTSQMNIAISDAVSDIEIGGRNLLLWTGEMPIASSGSGNAVTDKSGVCGWGSWWPVSTNDGVKTEYTGSNPQQCIGFPLANNGSVENGDEVVLTFEARGNLTSFGQFYWIQLTGANIALNFTPTGPALSETEWNKYTFVPDTTSANVRTCAKVLIYYNPGNAANKWIEIRKGSVKLEKGNKATGWSPAPEDLASASTGIYYATCETAAGTAVKVATTEQSGFSLVPGAMVNVKFTATNSAAVANLKLNVNDTGEKPIKYIYNNTLNNLPGTNYLVANNMYTFRYDGTNWVVQLMYNTNDTAMYTKYYNSILAGEKLTAESIIGGRSDGKFYELSGSGDYFELSYPLLWATSTINSGATNYSSIFTQCYDRNLGTYYTSFNTGGINKIVYLVGTVSGNKFTLNGSTSASYLTCNEPTTENGLFYIPIGRLGNQSNGKNYFNFQVAVPVTLYAYLDGKFRQVTPTEIVATQRIYWRTGTAGAPTAPTSWVTASTNTYASWTTKVPPLAASTASGQTKYPYLYTCEQRKRLDGTVECTPVLLDENTTVIDGGTIITNSIHANKITAGTMETGVFTSTAQKTILNSEIEIGGRNYVLNSAGVLASHLESGNEYIAINLGQSYMDIEDHTQVTVSFDLEMTVVTANPTLLLYNTNVKGPKQFSNETLQFTATAGTTIKGRYSVTSLILDRANPTVSYNTLEFYSTYNTGNVFSIANLKLEVGNKATDWTPAPEDMASASTGVYYATCETAAGTAVKVATTEQTGFSLVTGAMVNVKFTATNSAAVANLKLNVNNTGEKPIKYIYNNSLSNLPGTNYLLANNMYTFRYDGTNWVVQLMYNSNTYDRRLHNNYIKAESAVASGKLACATSAGYKAIAAGVEFDLAYPILWAGGAWAAGSQYANAYEAYPSVNPATTATVQGIAVNSMVYLKGTVSGGTFVVASTNFLTCTVPTSEDGYYYIPLGIVANNATTQMYFSTSDKLYAYYENSFQRVDVSATTRAIAAGKKADDVNSALGTLQTTVTSQIQNLGDSVQVSVNSITSRLDSQDEILSDVTNTFDFTADGLVIGKSNSPVKSVLDNQALRFQAHAQDVMVLNGESSTAEMDRLKIGKYRWTSVDGGNAIALMYVG